MKKEETIMTDKKEEGEGEEGKGRMSEWEDLTWKVGGRNTRLIISCIAASLEWIAIGTNSGSIYLYQRNSSFKLIALFSIKEIRDPLQFIKFSPNGSLLSISTSKDSLFILEHPYHSNLNNSTSSSKKGKEKLIGSCISPSEISCMCWSLESSDQFYSYSSSSLSSSSSSSAINLNNQSLSNNTIINGGGKYFCFGTVQGQVCIASIKKFSIGMNVEVLYKCDSGIVQLDFLGEDLLISSHSRCTIYNFSRLQLSQVGGQLRDGKYGACFLRSFSGQRSEFLLAARPNRRVWKAEISSASVKQTLNFKASAEPSFSHCIGFDSSEMKSSSVEKLNEEKQISVNGLFSNLECVNDNFIIAWDSSSFHLIDLSLVQIVESHSELTTIFQIAKWDNILYILHSSPLSSVALSKIVLPVGSNFVEPSPINSVPVDLKESSHSISETVTSNSADNLLSSSTTQIGMSIPSPSPPKSSNTIGSPSSSFSNLISSIASFGKELNLKEDSSKSEEHNNLKVEEINEKLSGNEESKGAGYIDHTNEKFPEPEVTPPVKTRKVKGVKKKSKKKGKVAEILSPSHNTALSPIRSSSITFPSSIQSSSSMESNNQNATSSETLPPIAPIERSSSSSDLSIEHKLVNSLKNKVATFSNQLEGIQLPSPLKSLIKDGFTISSKFLDSPPNNNQLSSSSSNLLESAIDQESVQSRNSRREEDTKIELTSSVYNSLEAFRRNQTNEEGIVSLLQKWVEFYEKESEKDANFITTLSVPSSWITELFTSLFEFKIIQKEWKEEEAISYLQKYWSFLHKIRSFSVCNQIQMKEAIQLFLGSSSLEGDNKKSGTLMHQIETLLESGDAKEALRVIKKSNNPILTLKYLDPLMEKIPSAIVQYCAFCYPSILPWNVLQYLDIENSKNVSPLHSYLDSLLKSHPECGLDQSLVHLLFECCLADGCPPLSEMASFDSSHRIKPKQNAHTFTWNHADRLLSIIEGKQKLIDPKSQTNVEMVYSSDPTHLKVLCEKFGYFVGLVALYRKSNQIRRSLDLILQMDDIDTLTQVMSTNFDSFDWNYLITKSQEQSYNSPPQINEKAMFDLMLSRIGPVSTLQLIQKQSKFLEKLEITSFERLLDSSFAEAQQRAIRKDLSESLSSYFWSANTPILAPQFKNSLDREQQGIELPFSRKTNVSHRNHTRIELQFEYTAPTKRFFEERGSHWGTTIYSQTTSNCPLCGLSLRESNQPTGIFPCGHAFHQSCLGKRDACESCFSSNFASILD
eukprot:TRINITY_DN2217_c0_g1_i6.p1 TRINITY_DN2217_c0_g1~~TRINITY_DN2217_c0_g1_i6.p1  ORF type:complete len:1261 (-),score=381.67 TRINITY_DN2217_c0_g1_i6:1663-5445(-)